MPSLAGAHAQPIPGQTDRDWPGYVRQIQLGKPQIKRLYLILRCSKQKDALAHLCRDATLHYMGATGVAPACDITT
jgi:hypothetical protein